MADQGRFGLPKLDVKPYAKWAVPNTSTVSNDPANQINRAKGKPQKETPGVTFNNDTTTINDGTTDVVVSNLTKKPSMSPDFSSLQEKQHYPPCINPTCKSFGRSHPNCLCYAGPGGSSLEQGHFAHGGMICNGPHHESCEHYADGGQVQEQNEFINNPGKSIDNVAAHHGLLGVLTKLGHNGRSENDNKHFEEYIDHSKRGDKTTTNHAKSLIGKEKLDISHDHEGRENLKKHLQDLRENPDKMLEIGGNLGSVLPMHAATLGARAANATNYLNNLKPKPSQGAPLDPVIPPGKSAEAMYNRQLDIAQRPHLVFKHIKDGTIQPLDLMTLKTLYPDLHQSMVEKAAETIIDAKKEGKDISYRETQGLSDLLGQPLDLIQTPMAMQAIMMANRPMQAPQNQKQSKKASGVELKQIDKTNSQLATPDQARLMDRKS